MSYATVNFHHNVEIEVTRVDWSDGLSYVKIKGIDERGNPSEVTFFTRKPEILDRFAPAQPEKRPNT